jgi:hypothetical protein
MQKSVIQGMDFYIGIIKREMFRLKKDIISIREEFQKKKFKKVEDRYNACMQALQERIVNVPLTLHIENPPSEFPIHQLNIVFDEVRGAARATYKKERTHIENDVIIQATIGLKLEFKLSDKNPIEVRELVYSRVPHELTHLYQHYKWKDKVDYEKNKQIAKKEFGRVAIWNRQIAENKDNSKTERNLSEGKLFLTNYISKAIYYFSEKEIGAKVTQTYYELIKEKAVKPTKRLKNGYITKKELYEKLKSTTHWDSLESYEFNLDILYDLIQHGHTVVMVDSGKKVKMKFTDEELKDILLQVDKAIDAKEEDEEKAIIKRKVDVPNRVSVPKVDKRTEILKKYNLNTNNPKPIYLNLFKHFEKQMKSFRRRLLKLAMYLPESYETK